MERLVRGLLIELRPLPVIATLTAVFFAFLLTDASFTHSIFLFLASIFFILYATHFLDTYEDHYVRKEDQYKTFLFAHGASGILTKNELLFGASVSSVGFFIITLYLSRTAGLVLFFLSFASYLIGVLYSRYISKNAFLSLLAYPIALLLAMNGIYFLALSFIDPKPTIHFSSIFLLFLGTRIWMDMADMETDKKGGKPNVSSMFGKSKVKKIGFLILLAGIAIASFLYNSLIYFLLLASLVFLFYHAYQLEPRKGIRQVLFGVFAFLVIQIFYVSI